MNTQPTTFEDVLADLSQHNVKYLLVGGLAVALCGFVRTTLDIDILIQADEENIRRLLDRLKHFGEGSASELTPADFTLEEGSIRIVEDFPLDVFTIMSGDTYEDLLPLSSTHQIDDVEISYLNAEGLIKLKSSSLRPQDQLDVQALRAIQQRQNG